MNFDRASDIAYAGVPPERAPAYPLAEAARYLGLPASTLRRWLTTGRLEGSGGRRSRALSFRGCVRACALGASRRGEGHAGWETVPDAKGIVRSLRLAVRRQAIVIDPLVACGQPTIEGTGVRTAVVASRHRAGDVLDDLATDYGCSVEAIRAAVSFEARMHGTVGRATRR